MSGVPAPALALFAHLVVDVGAPLDLGPAADGHRRLVPILGGTVEGPGGGAPGGGATPLRGRVLPGGADHQVLRTDELTELDAQYALETDDGHRIAVRNAGLRAASAADTAALVRGERVDPSRVYFASTPRLACAAPELAWVTSRIFVAVGTRTPDQVLLDVFALV